MAASPVSRPNVLQPQIGGCIKSTSALSAVTFLSLQFCARHVLCRHVPHYLAAADFRGNVHCFRRIMHCSSYSTCALSALTYAIMAPYIAFTTYLCLIYGVKFSPTQAALWITRVGRYSTGTVRNTCSSTVPEDFAGTGVAVTVPQVFVLSLNKVY